MACTFVRPMRRVPLVLFALLVAGNLWAQRVGIVLSGGGATGMAHIGVLKALEENGIPVDCIAGSSMGALIGGMYAAGWSPVEIDSIFNTDLNKLMAAGGIEDRYLHYFKQDAPDASLVNVKIDLDTTLQLSLPTNLRSPVLIDFEQMRAFAPASKAAGYNMDSLFVPFRCVASDITANRPVTFSKGDLAMAVRASMSYPFYFKPIRVDGHLMMDGGLFNNFPSDVLYQAFLPDVIIGSNVGYNGGPPSEDDLMSQLRAMMQQQTDYSIPCEHSVIVAPKSNTGLFDFNDPEATIQDGYNAAMERMPEIKAIIEQHRTAAETATRRAQWKSRLGEPVFGDVRISGLTKQQTKYAERTLIGRRPAPMTAGELKPRYFRLFADYNVGGLHPKATWNKQNGNYDLDVLVKREKDLDVRFGGIFSSRPVNTGMVGLRYHIFGRSSARLEALSYFGKFYSAGQAKLRVDLSTQAPIYLEPVFTLHRWDHFTSFTTFFDEVRPSYIVLREGWGGFNVGLSAGNKGLLRYDFKYVQTQDSYYQQLEWNATDTADVTEFYHVTTGLLIERNSLNRKQHPNAGECIKAELRYFGGDEVTTPGTLGGGSRQPENHHHEWLTAKVTFDKYFVLTRNFRLGVLAEGLYSSYPAFSNYTATIARAPVFQPTPESRTYFLEDFRASQYIAAGARAIIAVAKNRFDLRLEGYAFQPYKKIEREAIDQPAEGTPISDRYFLASGSLIYQSPIGPVWFNTSYIDGLENPWAVSLNFGYVIFAQRSAE